MDHAEEQQTEIEALESIYPNEYKLISSDPYAFSIYIKSEVYDPEADEPEGFCCTLKFTFTKKYPEEVPLIEILGEDDENPATEEESNLEEEDMLELKSLLSSTAEENTGMAMIFTLVTTALEWMNESWDKRLRDKEEEVERKQREEEEAEQKRFEGTRVTAETFAAWKTQFDYEMSLLKKEKDAAEKEKEKKLTGRELFTQDKTLRSSDLKFTEEEGDVPIDESLFEDIGDLDLDDDDPDYDPNADSDDD